jgi:hypothetical protein
MLSLQKALFLYNVAIAAWFKTAISGAKEPSKLPFSRSISHTNLLTKSIKKKKDKRIRNFEIARFESIQERRWQMNGRILNGLDLTARSLLDPECNLQ